MKQGAILGALRDRVKTDIRVTKPLARQIDLVCRAIGIPKNAFYTLAAGILVLQLSPFLPGMKRQNLLAVVTKLFQKVVVEVKKTL